MNRGISCREEVWQHHEPIVHPALLADLAATMAAFQSGSGSVAFQRCCHPGLPAGARGFPSCQYLWWQTQADGDFGLVQFWTSAFDQPVAFVQIGFPEKSSVSSGASSGPIQVLRVFRLFTGICFPYADDAACLAAWRPDQHDHALVERPYGNEARLCISQAPVLQREVQPGEDLCHAA